MRRSILVAVAVAALALGAGFHLGSRWAPAPPNRARGDTAPPPEGTVGAQVYSILLKDDLLERMGGLAPLLQRQPPQALDQVLGAFEAVAFEVSDPEIVLLAEWWARSDPAAAFEWARRNRIGRHPAVLGEVARIWGRRNPEEAWQAIQGSLQDNALLSRSLVGVVRGWEESGRPGLLDFLATLPDTALLQRSIDVVARRIVLRKGPEEALRWAESLPDDVRGVDNNRFKHHAMRRVAGAVAEIDPERAAAFASEHGEGPYGRGMYRRVGVRLAEKDGEAAMRWLATLPPGPQRDSAVGESYRTWSFHEPGAPQAWVLRSEIEPWMDPAVAMYALGLTTTSHAEALAWAARVHDPGRRRQTTIRIYQSWLLADEAEAQAAIQEAGVSEADRNLIFRRFAHDKARRAAIEQATRAARGPSPAPEID